MKNWKLSALALVMALFLSSCGDDNNSDNGEGGQGGQAVPARTSIYQGWWKVPSESPDGLEVDMTVKFQERQITVKAVCKGDGKTAVAEVSAPAVVRDGSISIERDAERTVNNDGLRCTANVEAGEAQYRLHNGNLVVTKDGESLTLRPTN